MLVSSYFMLVLSLLAANRMPLCARLKYQAGFKSFGGRYKYIWTGYKALQASFKSDLFSSGSGLYSGVFRVVSSASVLGSTAVMAGGGAGPLLTAWSSECLMWGLNP